MEHLGPLIDEYLREGLEIRSDLGLNFVAAQLGLEAVEFRAFLSGKVVLSDGVLQSFQNKFGDGSTEIMLNQHLALKAA